MFKICKNPKLFELCLAKKKEEEEEDEEEEEEER